MKSRSKRWQREENRGFRSINWNNIFMKSLLKSTFEEKLYYILKVQEAQGLKIDKVVFFLPTH
jgi:hypothetical protein